MWLVSVNLWRLDEQPKKKAVELPGETVILSIRPGHLQYRSVYQSFHLIGQFEFKLNSDCSRMMYKSYPDSLSTLSTFLNLVNPVNFINDFQLHQFGQL